MSSQFPIWRRSQSRAVLHSRFTVAGEMRRTSAVSSIESPPKKEFYNAVLLRIELVINQWHQLIESLFVAITPLDQ